MLILILINYLLLKALSALSPSGEGNSEPVGSAGVARAASEVLREWVSHAQLLPLLHSLVDALLDRIASSARGASMVLGINYDNKYY